MQIELRHSLETSVAQITVEARENMTKGLARSINQSINLSLSLSRSTYNACSDLYQYCSSLSSVHGQYVCISSSNAVCVKDVEM